MEELREHLRQENDVATFEPGEYNYIIIWVYVLLKIAVRERCDTLTFTDSYGTCSRQGRLVRQFPKGAVLRPTTTFRQAIEKILERDEVVRRHVQPVSETPDSATYHLG